MHDINSIKLAILVIDKTGISKSVFFQAKLIFVSKAEPTQAGHLRAPKFIFQNSQKPYGNKRSSLFCTIASLILLTDKGGGEELS